MGVLIQEDIQITFKLATSRQDFKEIKHFRKEYGDINENIEPGFLEREKDRDAQANIFMFFNGDQLIASMRLIQMGKKISVIESTLNESFQDEYIKGLAWESGRFVIHPSYRGLGISRECFGNTLEWLRDNSICQTIFAPIRKSLALLYENYGFYKISSKEIDVNNETLEYSIIKCDLVSLLNRCVSKGYKKNTPKYALLNSQSNNIKSNNRYF